MTREEAIVLIERSVNELKEMMQTITMPQSAAEQLQKQIDAHEMAISALRQESVTNRNGLNDPLTLDELRKMDGEPVWTVTIGLSDSGRWELCACETICACPLHKVLRCVTATGECTDYEFDTCGKTWLAYRQKPEEGTV